MSYQYSHKVGASPGNVMLLQSRDTTVNSRCVEVPRCNVQIGWWALTVIQGTLCRLAWAAAKSVANQSSIGVRNGNSCNQTESSIKPRDSKTASDIGSYRKVVVNVEIQGDDMDLSNIRRVIAARVRGDARRALSLNTHTIGQDLHIIHARHHCT